MQQDSNWWINSEQYDMDRIQSNINIDIIDIWIEFRVIFH